MEDFYNLCRENNLKITPQRVSVYKLLASSTAHPSADQIHKTLKKDFPNISLDTVNRTLITFASAGMIRVVEGHGDPRRFDPNTDDHHHFYCLSCRGIFDFKDEALDRISISPETRARFTITGKRVCLTGYCEECTGQSG